MKKNLNSIPLTIVTILISIATSWGIIQAKVNAIEKAADKNEKTLDDVRDFRGEQRAINSALKEDIGEVKETIKEVLKAIKDIR